MKTWENEFPPGFPIELISHRALEEGEARRRRRLARQHSLIGASLVVLLLGVGLTAVVARGEGGRRLSAGAGPVVPVRVHAVNGKIAFVRSAGPDDPAVKVYVMNPDGSAQTFVRELPSVNNPQWSPDGTRLVFSNGQDIFVMKGDGTDLRQLTTDGASNSWPTWSPDGGRIAYRSIRSSPDSTIWVMNADGGDQRVLASALFGSWPAWSPDGGRIAYSSGGADGGASISIVSVDGKAAKRVIAIEGFADAPSWSPDATKIAFRHNNDISVVHADGSAVKQLATPPPTAVDRPPGSGTPTAPTWSPDGSKIAYALFASVDNCSIWTMNPDGTGQTQLTDGKSCDRDASWQPVPRP